MGRVRAVALASVLLAGVLAGTGSTWAAIATSTVEDRVEVTVRSPEGAIDDLRGGRLLLLVRNLGGDDLVLTAVTPVAGVSEADLQYTFGAGTGCRTDDADGTEELLVLPCAVPPAGQALIPVVVEIDALSRTGKTVAAFDVGYRHGDDAGNVVAVADLALGVFGESEIAPLLQVPSILVLPGVLFLVVLTVLWRLGTRPVGREPDDFPVKASGAEFWIAAAVLSIVLVAGWMLTGRNLLRGYGYQDIRNLALAAVGLAAATGLALAGARYAEQRAERTALEREAARRLVPGDGPETALARLARWDGAAGLNRPVVTVGAKNRLLYHGSQEGGPVVGRQLLYATGAAPPEVVEEIDRLRDAGRIAPLAQAVDKARKQGHVTVTWAGGEGPQAVGADAYDEPTGETKPAIQWVQD